MAGEGPGPPGAEAAEEASAGMARAAAVVVMTAEQYESEQDEQAPASSDWPATAQYPVSHDDLAAIPRQVDRYLKADERNVIAVRQSWAVLAGPAAAVLFGLVAAVAVNGWLYASGHAPASIVHVIWWAYLAAAGWGIWKWLEWRASWFVITADRLMVISGLVRQRVDMLPYGKLRDVSMSQGVTGRLLNYGTFHCESIGTDHALHTIERIPGPHELYVQVCELTVPATGKLGPKL